MSKKRATKVEAANTIEIDSVMIGTLVKGGRVIVEDTEIVLAEAVEEMEASDIMGMIQDVVDVENEEADEDEDLDSYHEDDEEDEEEEY
jgi:hypothetical protein